jgi:hypothetical protein
MTGSARRAYRRRAQLGPLVNANRSECRVCSLDRAQTPL